jgi:hypothetical protein
MSKELHYAYEGSGSHTIYDEHGNVAGHAVEGEGFNREEATENARLFAASTDLLAACKSALSTLEDYQLWHDDGSRCEDVQDAELESLRAAIARVEGNSNEPA